MGQEYDKIVNLHSACKKGHLEQVAQLADSAGLINCMFNGANALIWACLEGGHPEVVELLIKRGADVNPRGCGVLPLHAAVQSRNLAVVRLLLSAGANPNARCERYGDLALQIALQAQRWDLVAALLEAGARLNQSTNGVPVWWLLAFSNSSEVAAVLRKTPQWYDQKMPDGKPLLHSFAICGSSFWLDLAIKDGADIHAVVSAECGSTLLHEACAGGYEEAVRYLLGVGANVDARNGTGGKPYEIAIGLRRVNVVWELMKHEGLGPLEPFHGQTLEEWFADSPNALQRCKKIVQPARSEACAAELWKVFVDAGDSAGPKREVLPSPRLCF